MNRDNPFSFNPSAPYDYNPFRLLRAAAADTSVMIDEAARTHEHLLENHVVPVPGIAVTSGDFMRAASELHDPLKRLAFDIFAHCTESDS
jgi:hypothetical protein